MTVVLALVERGMTRAGLVGLFALASTTHAGTREIPFWPDDVPAAIHAQVDGVAALETVRELSRFHRVHGSPGFAAAAEHLARKLRAAGLSEVAVEHFPADGETRYAHFRSYLGWNPVEATLEEMGPDPHRLAAFPDLPVALADYSQDADVTASLVDVGSGTEAKDYDGKDVNGRIVIASGPLPLVHRRACEERGAAGFLSDFPNQETAWSGDDRDLVRWGHLSPYETRNTFAFMLSKRQSEALRQRLARGETVTVRAHVRARMVAATYDVVNAVIPGTDAGEVVLTAHLCHQSAGANDNASGSAAIFEAARALQAAILARTLAPPRRTIRFLWLPEIAGSQAYLIRHPDVVARAVGGVHMDMVGGLLGTTHGTFHISRAAESHPHIVSDIAETFFEEMERVSSHFAERGGDPYRGFVWLPGSRETFLGDMRALEMGSDHEVFQDASFGIPMVYFHDWPDVTIHTNKDQPENLDATKLGRVAYLGAGIAWTLAALPESEAPALVAVAKAGNARRLARATLASARTADPRDGALFAREAIATSRETLRSISKLWPSTTDIVAGEERRLQSTAPRVPPTASPDGRVPVRNPEVRGPLGVYYYDHLAAVLGPDVTTSTALTHRDGGDILAFEVMNLVNATRSVSEIRDMLSGRYEPVPVAQVAEYLDLMARARVIRWK